MGLRGKMGCDISWKGPLVAARFGTVFVRPFLLAKD